MKKLGILGAPDAHSFLLSQLTQTKRLEVSGIFDPDPAKTESLCRRLNVSKASNPFGIISESDMLLITLSGEKSYNLIIESILNGKHVVVANPQRLSIPEAEALLKIAKEGSVSVIPAHPYICNPCLESTKPFINNPLLIDIQYCNAPETLYAGHRHETLLTIVNILGMLVKANLKKLHTHATSITGNGIQLLNVWMTFDNGCNVTLSVNGMSLTPVFNIKTYQYKQLIDIDMLTQVPTIKNFDSEHVTNFTNTQPTVTPTKNIFEHLVAFAEMSGNIHEQLNLMEHFIPSLQICKTLEERFEN